MSEARERVVELLIGHLQAGYQPSWLRKRLYEWGNEAINPSTYFVERLEGLSPPKLTVVTNDQHHEPEPEQVQDTTDGNRSSPVSWLTDDQFAALSPATRAEAAHIGECPKSELSPFDQQRYTNVLARLNSVEITGTGA